MKKFPIILAAVICIITLSGCQTARNLNSISIVVGMGVDNAPEADQTLVTFQIVNPEAMQNPSSDKGQSAGKAYWNISQAGETIFDAARDVTHQTGKKLYFSHSDVIILGRNVAEAGLQKVMDFFLRNTEMRPKSWILIADGTAEEVFNIESKFDKIPSQNLAKTVKDFHTSSHFKAISIQEFANNLLSEATSPIIPLVKVIEKNSQKTISIDGLAVLNKDKMVGTLNETETRGLLWVTGDVTGGVIPISSSDGKGKLSVEIISAKSKIIPQINADHITMHIKIFMEGAITEQTVPQSLEKLPTIALLEQNLAGAIEEEILAALIKSQELSADIFGFGDMIHKRFPNKWAELKNNWPAAYATIVPSIDVEAKIVRTNALATSVAPAK